MDYSEYDNDLFFEQCDFERRLKREYEYQSPSRYSKSENEDSNKWTLNDLHNFQKRLKKLKCLEDCNDVSNIHEEKISIDTQKLVNLLVYFENGRIKVRLN